MFRDGPSRTKHALVSSQMAEVGATAVVCCDRELETVLVHNLVDIHSCLPTRVRQWTIFLAHVRGTSGNKS